MNHLLKTLPLSLHRTVGTSRQIFTTISSSFWSRSLPDVKFLNSFPKTQIFNIQKVAGGSFLKSDFHLKNEDIKKKFNVVSHKLLEVSSTRYYYRKPKKKSSNLNCQIVKQNEEGLCLKCEKPKNKSKNLLKKRENCSKSSETKKKLNEKDKGCYKTSSVGDNRVMVVKRPPLRKCKSEGFVAPKLETSCEKKSKRKVWEEHPTNSCKEKSPSKTKLCKDVARARENSKERVASKKVCKEVPKQQKKKKSCEEKSPSKAKVCKDVTKSENQEEKPSLKKICKNIAMSQDKKKSCKEKLTSEKVYEEAPKQKNKDRSCKQESSSKLKVSKDAPKHQSKKENCNTQLKDDDRCKMEPPPKCEEFLCKPCAKFKFQCPPPQKKKKEAKESKSTPPKQTSKPCRPCSSKSDKDKVPPRLDGKLPLPPKPNKGIIRSIFAAIFAKKPQTAEVPKSLVPLPRPENNNPKPNEVTLEECIEQKIKHAKNPPHAIELFCLKEKENKEKDGKTVECKEELDKDEGTKIENVCGEKEKNVCEDEELKEKKKEKSKICSKNETNKSNGGKKLRKPSKYDIWEPTREYKNHSKEENEKKPKREECEQSQEECGSAVKGSGTSKLEACEEQQNKVYSKGGQEEQKESYDGNQPEVPNSKEDDCFNGPELKVLKQCKDDESTVKKNSLKGYSNKKKVKCQNRNTLGAVCNKDSREQNDCSQSTTKEGDKVKQCSNFCKDILKKQKAAKIKPPEDCNEKQQQEETCDKDQRKATRRKQNDNNCDVNKNKDTEDFHQEEEALKQKPPEWKPPPKTCEEVEDCEEESKTTKSFCKNNKNGGIETLRERERKECDSVIEEENLECEPKKKLRNKDRKMDTKCKKYLKKYEEKKEVCKQTSEEHKEEKLCCCEEKHLKTKPKMYEKSCKHNNMDESKCKSNRRDTCKEEPKRVNKSQTIKQELTTKKTCKTEEPDVICEGEEEKRCEKKRKVKIKSKNCDNSNRISCKSSGDNLKSPKKIKQCLPSIPARNGCSNMDKCDGESLMMKCLKECTAMKRRMPPTEPPECERFCQNDQNCRRSGKCDKKKSKNDKCERSTTEEKSCVEKSLKCLKEVESDCEDSESKKCKGEEERGKEYIALKEKRSSQRCSKKKRGVREKSKKKCCKVMKPRGNCCKNE